MCPKTELHIVLLNLNIDIVISGTYRPKCPLESVKLTFFVMNRHSWGIMRPQTGASVIFLKSVRMKMPVFLLFLTHIMVGFDVLLKSS